MFSSTSSAVEGQGHVVRTGVLAGCEFILFFKTSPEDLFIEFRVRGRKARGERNIDVKNIDKLPPICAQLGIKPATYLSGLSRCTLT